MDLELAGKKAIVTGGTRGIGRAIVETLATEGCRVGLCARDAAAVTATVTALNDNGRTTTGRAVDVGDREALSGWVEAVGHEFGGLDIVIANVSGYGTTPDDTGWQQSFEIDMMGTVHTVEAARPFLERSDAAAIVVISSVAALESFTDVFPPGGLWPYAVVKAGLTNYVANLSRTLAPQGIRANTVSAGAIYFPGGGGHGTSGSTPRSLPRWSRGVLWAA